MCSNHQSSRISEAFHKIPFLFFSLQEFQSICTLAQLFSLFHSVYCIPAYTRWQLLNNPNSFTKPPHYYTTKISLWYNLGTPHTSVTCPVKSLSLNILFLQPLRLFWSSKRKLRKCYKSSNCFLWRYATVLQWEKCVVLDHEISSYWNRELSHLWFTDNWTWLT